jgi:hypothetical protein
MLEHCAARCVECDRSYYVGVTEVATYSDYSNNCNDLHTDRTAVVRWDVH